MTPQMTYRFCGIHSFPAGHIIACPLEEASAAATGLIPGRRSAAGIAQFGGHQMGWIFPSQSGEHVDAPIVGKQIPQLMTILE
jgi:hypothetical protein